MTPDERYRSARDAGRCLGCQKRPRLEGRSRCRVCLFANRVQLAARRDRRLAAGLCAMCGVAPAVGYRCGACEAKRTGRGGTRRTLTQRWTAPD